MARRKTVYQIRQGYFTDGHSVFEESPAGAKVLSLSQAPVGHPAHEINKRIPKSSSVRREPWRKVKSDEISTVTQRPLSKSPEPAEIRKAREKAGLTQKEAGELIGAPVRTWQDWEYGKRNMPAAKWELWQIKMRGR